ncbi:hypothetical protein Tco_0653039 [Tanacetum coccineum]|uniref:Uncharacterized protein n=1 Tax=Tanacetum coccineum TaxID=301880 RepID=A0ABQ4X020_9ASTR
MPVFIRVFQLEDDRCRVFSAPLVSIQLLEVQILGGGVTFGAISPWHLFCNEIFKGGMVRMHYAFCFMIDVRTEFLGKIHYASNSVSVVISVVSFVLQSRASVMSIFQCCGKLDAVIGKDEWSILLKEDGSLREVVFAGVASFNFDSQCTPPSGNPNVVGITLFSFATTSHSSLLCLNVRKFPSEELACGTLAPFYVERTFSQHQLLAIMTGYCCRLQNALLEMGVGSSLSSTSVDDPPNNVIIEVRARQGSLEVRANSRKFLFIPKFHRICRFVHCLITALFIITPRRIWKRNEDLPERWTGCGTLVAKEGLHFGPLSPWGIGFTTEKVGIGWSLVCKHARVVIPAKSSLGRCCPINVAMKWWTVIDEEWAPPQVNTLSSTALTGARCMELEQSWFSCLRAMLGSNILSSAKSDKQLWVEEFVLPWHQLPLARDIRIASLTSVGALEHWSHSFVCLPLGLYGTDLPEWVFLYEGARITYWQVLLVVGETLLTGTEIDEAEGCVEGVEGGEWEWGLREGVGGSWDLGRMEEGVRLEVTGRRKEVDRRDGRGGGGVGGRCGGGDEEVGEEGTWRRGGVRRGGGQGGEEGERKGRKLSGRGGGVVGMAGRMGRRRVRVGEDGEEGGWWQEGGGGKLGKKYCGGWIGRNREGGGPERVMVGFGRRNCFGNGVGWGEIGVDGEWEVEASGGRIKGDDMEGDSLGGWMAWGMGEWNEEEGRTLWEEAVGFSEEEGTGGGVGEEFGRRMGRGGTWGGCAVDWICCGGREEEGGGTGEAGCWRGDGGSMDGRSGGGSVGWDVEIWGRRRSDRMWRWRNGRWIRNSVETGVDLVGGRGEGGRGEDLEEVDWMGWDEGLDGWEGGGVGLAKGSRGVSGGIGDGDSRRWKEDGAMEGGRLGGRGVGGGVDGGLREGERWVRSGRWGKRGMDGGVWSDAWTWEDGGGLGEDGGTEGNLDGPGGWKAGRVRVKAGLVGNGWWIGRGRTREEGLGLVVWRRGLGRCGWMGKDEDWWRGRVCVEDDNVALLADWMADFMGGESLEERGEDWEWRNGEWGDGMGGWSDGPGGGGGRRWVGRDWRSDVEGK